MASLLDQLRTLSSVDCDTLDAEVAAKYGPFVDCTSNQAIALAELSKVDGDGKALHQQLILESLQVAHWQFGKQTDATLEELAVELMMVSLSLRIAPHAMGFLHVQTNPKLAYSTQKTIKNAERIVSHFKQLAPDFDTSRVCIKIPSTWEGLQACRELNKKGLTTLATTVFSLEQAALAADAGCRYIAPYVNELRVHFDPKYNDLAPALPLCSAIQHHLLDTRPDTKTQVLAASFTSVTQIMQLAGTPHITVPPALLGELAGTLATGWSGAEEIGKAALGSGAAAAGAAGGAVQKLGAGVLKDESTWRMAFTRAGGGAAEGKLVQAINIFANVQESLEGIVKGMEGR